LFHKGQTATKVCLLAENTLLVSEMYFKMEGAAHSRLAFEYDPATHFLDQLRSNRSAKPGTVPRGILKTSFKGVAHNHVEFDLQLSVGYL
jgi:hypothetical protein